MNMDDPGNPEMLGCRLKWQEIRQRIREKRALRNTDPFRVWAEVVDCTIWELLEADPNMDHEHARALREYRDELMSSPVGAAIVRELARREAD